MESLPERVCSTFTRQRWWPARGPLVVAVSGGLDSMVLLHVLTPLARERGAGLVVAHANHGLRGAESERDEAFVRAAAAGLDWPCVVGRLDVRDEMARTRESLEMSARRLRHRFLAQTAREHGATVIALAHHAGDQAELFLLRLLRGAGGAGLGGMAAESPSPADPELRLIRPLLAFSREEIRSYAAAAGLEFVEDSSNQDVALLRNRVRHELLPLLRRDFNPAVESALKRAAELVGADADCVRELALKWLRSRRTQAFAKLPVAVQRAVLREQLWQAGHEPDFELIERLRLAEQAVSLSRRETAARGTDGAVCIRPVTAAPDFSRFRRPLDLRRVRPFTRVGGTEIHWRLEASTKAPVPSAKGLEQFDAGEVGRHIVLRRWQPGDRFQPLGLPAASKLQDLFVNRKIPVARRRELLVATTRAGEIFWVESLPPGEAFKLTGKTRTRLVWEFRRAN